MVTFHREKKAEVTLFTHPNAHPYDSGLIIVNRNEQVDKWLAKEDKRPRWYQNRVNAGLHVIANRVIDEYLKLLADDEKMVVSDAGVHSDKTAIVPIGKIDLDRQILKPLSGTGKMYVYDSPEYVKIWGHQKGIMVYAKIMKKELFRQKICQINRRLFLDRDGTINKYVGFLRNIDEFELLPGVIEAIKKLMHQVI